MKDKRQANFIADLIASSVAPALVMGMIYCLISFLILVFYRDGFQTRVNYIFALYIFASVLIARIAIEQGRAYSLGYTAALGLATFVVIGRFVVFQGPFAALSPIINIGLLALVGYLADRIVFDCTLVENDRDTSGEGLLQSLGLVRSEISKQESKNSAAQPKKRRRKHNPGVTILYFALLAIPLFGIGQLFLPSGNDAVRRSALYLLCGYFLTSFSLLVTTSFLGLRRYLNQRGVDVPVGFTMTWLTMGLVGTIVFLTISLFLPLPGRELGLFDLPFQIRAIEGLTAHRFGWGNEGVPDNQSPSSNVNPAVDSSASENMAYGNDQNLSSRSGQSTESSEGSGSPGSNSSGSKGESSQGSGKSGGMTRSNSQSDSSTGSNSENNESSSGSGTSGKPSGGGESRGSNGESSTGSKTSGGTTSSNNPTGNSAGSSSQSAQSKSSDSSKDSTNSANGNGSDNSSQSRSTGGAGESNQASSQNGEQGRSSSEATGQDPKSSAESGSRDNAQANSGQADGAMEQSSEDSANLGEQELEQTSSSSAQPTSPAENSSFNFDFGMTFAALFKWITIAVLLCIVIYYALTHRDELRKLLADLRAWWNRLWGIAEDDSLPADLRDEAQSAAQRRRFSSFANPFNRRGGFKDMPELIRYTFAALEAWGAERGVVREEEQTAEEYLKRLVTQLPRCQEELFALATAYGRLAYAGGRNISLEPAAVQKIWTVMEQTAVATTVTSTISTA